MARKVVNRKVLREEAEAAEAAESEGVPKKKAKRKTAKRKKKVAADVRMKLFWGVFNQSLKRVALFELGGWKLANSAVGSPHERARPMAPDRVSRVAEALH